MVYELISSLFQPVITNPLVVGAAVGIIRSVCGWVENVLKQWEAGKKIEMVSGRKLLETILRVIPQELGMTALTGVPLTSFITDYVIKKAKK